MLLFLLLLNRRLFHFTISEDNRFTFFTSIGCSLKIIRKCCCHFQANAVFTSGIYIKFSAKFRRSMLLSNRSFHNFKRNATTIVENHNFSQGFIKIHLYSIGRRICIDTFIQSIIKDFFEKMNGRFGSTIRNIHADTSSNLFELIRQLYIFIIVEFCSIHF